MTENETWDEMWNRPFDRLELVWQEDNMYGYQRPRGLDCTVTPEPPAAEDWNWVLKQQAKRQATQTPNRRCAIYRHYDAEGRLLYVGKSVQPLNRQQQHEVEAHWFHQIVKIEIQWFELTTDMDAAERHAITTEAPIFNLAKW